MKKIVLVYGGNSTESEISILTALKTYKELKKVNPYVYLVFLDHNGNFYYGKSLGKLENYSIKRKFKKAKFVRSNMGQFIKCGIKKIPFDLVMILGHGLNVEDGTLSSYFEVKRIPYCYDDLSNVSLFQDKGKTKMMFSSLNINQTKFQIIYEHQYLKNNNLHLNIGFPLIVKPSRLGSSIGISKVNSVRELKETLIKSFKYDETIVLEEYIEDKIEYNIALLGYQENIILSEIEEVNHNKDILSFLDKYDYSNGNEKRIICPNISSSIKLEIQEVAKKVFEKFNLCGIYRFDFIYDRKKEILYLNEINSLPGSLAYYLFEPKGINMVELLLMYIDFHSIKNEKRKHLLSSYEDGFASKVDIDKLKK